MFLLFEAISSGMIEFFAVGIPESVGILVAGVVLTSAAVIMRKLMSDGKPEGSGDDIAR